MKPQELYCRLFEEVRRRQQWSRQPVRWNPEKGVVWFDVRVNEKTAVSKSMMEAGFVHDREVDLHDPARLNEYVSWVVAVSPIARDQWILALNTFVRTLA